jgi:membrane protein implicated in regulation of membrane protease activity
VVLVLFVIAAFFVPWPWWPVVLLCGVIAEIGEVVWGRRLARRMPAKAGVETLIGRRARVVEPCRPDGRVRIQGELWNAVCADGADAGDAVTVVGEHELTLEVERAGRSRRRGSSQREDAAAASDRFS